MPVLLAVLLGIGTLFGVRTHQLKGIRNSLEENLNATQATLSALKQKYSEEKAKGDTLQRAKLLADAQIREMEASLKEAAASLEAAADLQRELNGKAEAYEADIDAISKELETVAAEHNDTKEKLADASMTIRSRDGELEKKQSDIERLQSELKIAEQKTERLFADNRELAELSRELLVQFDEKGALASMLESEPFTQIKRVRLEEMMQAYMDRIDNASEVDSELN